MIVGFTGTSKGMTSGQRTLLAALLTGLAATEFHHGDDAGADAEAHTVARALRIPVVIHPPTNPRHRAFCAGAIRVEEPLPYLDRNHEIVEASDYMLATPFEDVGEKLRSGTWATVRYARKRKVGLTILRPDGSTEEE